MAGFLELVLHNYGQRDAGYRSASLVDGASAAWIMISAIRLNHAARTVFVVGPHPD